MHVHNNHCYCLDSIWGGHFNSRYMVCIAQYFPGFKYGDKPHADWTNLIDEEIKRGRELFDPFTYRLKSKVLNWLKKNIKDNVIENEKGFAVGTDDYNSHGSHDFTIWFYRRSDAMRFIKKWSIYKKPTTYFNYFKGIRKQYNFKTKTLQKVDKFDF